MKRKKIDPKYCNEPEVKVTFIKDRWHGRLIVDGKILNEMACECSEDIGWICREMLRWYSKLGGISNRTEFARERQIAKHQGKVWYESQLIMEKRERILKKIIENEVKHE